MIFKPKSKVEVFFIKLKIFFTIPSYKAWENINYYLAFDKFPISAKKVSDVYNTGYHYWSDDMKNYSIVLYRYRIIF